MRKSPTWRGEKLALQFLRVLWPIALIAVSFAPARARQTTPPPKNDGLGYGALIQSKIQRLQAEVERTRALVENGTLARIQLTQAEERLADAQDEGILADTLYGSTSIEKLTEAQADAMMKAAQRRVDRENSLVQERRIFLDKGVISQSEFDALTAEADQRRQVLVLAQNRLKLLADIRKMAETEKRAGQASAGTPGSLKDSMIRYDGNGAFSLSDVPTISSQFERRFHRPLPVSALGQTLLHQSLGLDHRNRVDVALSPDSSEGLWLRALLEKLHIPYLAFHSAVAGAATAPHIHIGLESTRLKPIAALKGS